jgi:wyosine [tRNA(Phe)-imidazoG37] synthetase (radical SAM superfamily)
VPQLPDLKVEVLDMELHGGCNYKCTFCPQSQGREREFLKRVSMEVFEKTVDDAMQYGLKTVTLHGSGEPTLHREFPAYVEAVKSRGLTCISFTNGLKLTAKLSEQLVDAGIDILRLSCIGYDKETYERAMVRGKYDVVRENARRFCEIAKGSASEMHMNHLIIDNEDIEHEVRMYKKNWGEHTGALQEVWMMHNWSGSDKIEIGYERSAESRRTCGRPFAPLLQIRAGGIGGQSAAVVACCMVLGKDSEGVLGHMSNQTISEVVSGELYTELRRAHAEERFDDISYCKGCDQLFDTPEALVWCNIEGREYQQSKNLPSLKFSDYA